MRFAACGWSFMCRCSVCSLVGFQLHFSSIDSNGTVPEVQFHIESCCQWCVCESHFPQTQSFNLQFLIDFQSYAIVAFVFSSSCVRLSQSRMNGWMDGRFTTWRNLYVQVFTMKIGPGWLNSDILVSVLLKLLHDRNWLVYIQMSKRAL